MCHDHFSSFQICVLGGRTHFHGSTYSRSSERDAKEGQGKSHFADGGDVYAGEPNGAKCTGKGRSCMAVTVKYTRWTRVQLNLCIEQGTSHHQLDPKIKSAQNFRESCGAERCVGHRAAHRPSDVPVQQRRSVHWRTGPEERSGDYVRRQVG
ncbi:unnamed protein product [Ectocarpus sp. 13 AM-2016]